MRQLAAYVKKDSIQHFPGLFDDEIQPANAYDNAAKKLHGRFV